MTPQFVRLLAGAAAGFAATLPMSLVMLARRRQYAQEYVDSLPPRQITSQALRSVGLSNLTNETEEALTVANHFAYGAAMGGVYGLTTPPQPAATALARGMFFGLGVWSVSYLGWLPATGFYRPATQDSRQRTLRMLAAHVMWGGTLGVLTEYLQRAMTAAEAPSAEPLPEPRKRTRIKPR